MDSVKIIQKIHLTLYLNIELLLNIFFQNNTCITFCYKLYLIENYIMKVQTAFRLEKELLEELKEQAKKNKRSLNNYVELILLKVVEKQPNKETVEAFEEAMNDKNLKPISDIDKFLDSI